MKKSFTRIVSIALVILMILSVLSLLAVSASAELTMDEIFTQGMVLQRREPISVYGTSFAGDTITVSLNGATANTTTGADGKWALTLPSMEAGGPYSLSVQGTESSKVIEDVLIGEVWIMAGQSNMEWSINLNINEDTYNTLKSFDYPDVRIFIQPVYDDQTGPGTWTKAHSLDNMMGGQMPWWSVLTVLYAKKLYLELGGNVPLGLIQAARGNTPIQSFMTKDMLDQEPALEEHFAGIRDGGSFIDVYETGFMYNKVIRDIDQYSIKGVVFYQGESNTQTTNNEVYKYGPLLERMISCWREKFGADTPFIINSTATWYNYDPNEFTGGQLINIQVANTLKNIPNTALVNNCDVRSANLIHPTYKNITAERCVKAAMALCYGGTDPYLNPSYKSHVVSGSDMIVSFNNANRGLKRMGFYASLPVLGFQIAGEDKVFYNATAEVYQGIKVKLSSANVPAPVYVRYAFAASPQLNLYNYEGFPMVQFDTSNFTGASNSQGYPIYDFPDPVPKAGETIIKLTPDQTITVGTQGIYNPGTSMVFSWAEDSNETGRYIQKYNITGIPAHSKVTKVMFRGKARDDIMDMEGSAGFKAYNVTGEVNYSTVTKDTLPDFGASNQIADGTVYGNIPNGSMYDVDFDPSFITGNGTYDIMYRTTGVTHQNFVTYLSNPVLYLTYKVDTPDSLELVSGPTKTEYAPGEAFDPTGMAINAVYSDGTVSASNFTYNIVTFDTGDTEIRVYYGGKYVTIPVTVVEKNVSSISVTRNPDKTEYVMGETLTTAGGQLTVTYTDNSTKVIALTNDMCNAIDLNTAGNKSVSVSYAGLTTTFPIKVTDPNGTGDPEYVLGDANGDNTVTILDALKIFKYISGKDAKPTDTGSAAFLAADADKNGEIAILDAVIIFKHIAGKITLG